MKNFIKKQKGITLIALVITIIVLLLLAGVAISMLSGENGILYQAATAVEKDHEQADQEKIKLAMGVYEISKYESDPKTLVETLQNEDWCESAIYDDTTKTTTVKFKDCGHEYVIPDSQEEKLLYFGEPYVGAMDENVVVMIFGEDGSGKSYFNGSISDEEPAGTFKYENGKIFIEGQDFGEIIDKENVVLDGVELHYRGEPFLCENPTHSANDGLNHWVMDEEGAFECMYSNENIPEGGEYYLSASDKYLKGNDR